MKIAIISFCLWIGLFITACNSDEKEIIIHPMMPNSDCKITHYITISGGFFIETKTLKYDSFNRINQIIAEDEHSRREFEIIYDENNQVVEIWLEDAGWLAIPEYHLSRYYKYDLTGRMTKSAWLHGIDELGQSVWQIRNYEYKNNTIEVYDEEETMIGIYEGLNERGQPETLTWVGEIPNVVERTSFDEFGNLIYSSIENNWRPISVTYEYFYDLYILYTDPKPELYRGNVNVHKSEEHSHLGGVNSFITSYTYKYEFAKNSIKLFVKTADFEPENAGEFLLKTKYFFECN